MSTARPPLIRSMTRPMTTFLSTIGLLHVVPDLHLLRFFAGEDDVAVAVLGALQQHVHDVAGLNGDLAVLVQELLDPDDAFRLVPDVDDDLGLGDLQDRALDHLAFRDVAEAAVVEVEQLGVFGRVGVELVPGFLGCPGGRCRLTSFVLELGVGRPLRLPGPNGWRCWRPPCVTSPPLSRCAGSQHRRAEVANRSMAISSTFYDSYRRTVKATKDDPMAKRKQGDAVGRRPGAQPSRRPRRGPARRNGDPVRRGRAGGGDRGGCPAADGWRLFPTPRTTRTRRRCPRRWTSTSGHRRHEAAGRDSKSGTASTTKPGPG